jgi:flagellar hook assembly protein FlgD
VAVPGHVSLRIYDLHGRCVRTLVDQVVPAGMHELTWDGTDAAGRRLASGSYVARLVAPDRTQNQRMMLLK